MVNAIHVALRANDRSYFAILKKEIRVLAFSAGFSERKVGEIDIIVAEMVSNLVKHAGGGTVLVKLIEEKGLQGIELISVDNGPGMTDITRMVSDGVSTKNTLGHGLGAMKRLSDVFQVYSAKDWGSVILVRVFEKTPSSFAKSNVADFRSVVIAKPGETVCGDRFFSKTNEEHLMLLLGDGLGHGIQAGEAVSKAGEAFLNCDEIDPPQIIRFINDSVKKTRGLVAAVAVFTFSERKWRICGVGNISTKLCSMGSQKNYTPYNGIVGLNVPNTLNAIEVEHEKGLHIIMCSDGLKSKWDLIKYPAILRYDLSIICSSLWKDHSRNTDDMSIMACKINL
jgi:anti-sigma regulatory factor (Ser/Thr protein kinase)